MTGLDHSGRHPTLPPGAAWQHQMSLQGGPVHFASPETSTRPERTRRGGRANRHHRGIMKNPRRPRPPRRRIWAPSSSRPKPESETRGFHRDRASTGLSAPSSTSCFERCAMLAMIVRGGAHRGAQQAEARQVLGEGDPVRRGEGGSRRDRAFATEFSASSRFLKLKGWRDTEKIVVGAAAASRIG